MLKFSIKLIFIGLLSSTLAFAMKSEEADFSPEPTDNSIQQYQKRIEQMQYRQNVYHEQMSQELMGLGLSYQNIGLHAEAVQAFSHAMHITRVNHGLYNLNQAPILERLIESAIKSNDIILADNRQQYYFYLYSRNYGDKDIRMLPALKKMANWKTLYQDGLEADAILMNLLSAHSLYGQYVDILKVNYGQYSGHLLEPLDAIANNSFNITVYVSGQYNDHISSEKPLFEVAKSFFKYGQVALQSRIEIMLQGDFSGSAEPAKAMVKLGDWYLLFDKRKSAFMQYQRAHQYLAANGLPQNNILNEPVAITGMVEKAIFPSTDGLLDENIVRASLNIDHLGYASGVKIIKPGDEKLSSEEKAFRRQLRKQKYRPRFENGVAVASKDVTLYLY